MLKEIHIEHIKSVGGQDVEELAGLITTVVEDGASVGFLPPMDHGKAYRYWETLLAPEVVLFIAKINNKIAGAVQLHLCVKENGDHRAEIAKLMTHPDFRRQGIGRLLMNKAEERAKLEGRTLLVLDTRDGDPSNDLYLSLGYTEVGRIPEYARSSNGELNATVIYYKML
jgi:ribosomal protein S18 acetylase RimI-like enzyme